MADQKTAPKGASTQTNDTGAQLDAAQDRLRKERDREQREQKTTPPKERRDPTSYAVLERIGKDDVEDVDAMLESGEVYVLRGQFDGRKDLDAIKACVGDESVEGRTFVAVPRWHPRTPARKVVEKTLWS